MSHKVSNVASWHWKSLMRLRGFFPKGLRWHLGNGRKINSWMDNWVFPYPISSVIQVVGGSTNLKVVDVINPDFTRNRSKICSLVPSHIVDTICSLYIPCSGREDELI